MSAVRMAGRNTPSMPLSRRSWPACGPVEGTSARDLSASCGAAGAAREGGVGRGTDALAGPVP